MAADARHSEDGRTWQDGTPIVWRIEPGVTRLVIGKPPRAGEAGESDAGIELAVALPPSLREVYPSLVHLHLWQISNLTRLPELPESLRTLDVRGCVGLEDLAPICAPLQTLLLEGCPELAIEDDFPAESLTGLEDLSLSGSVKIAQGWVRQVIDGASRLRRLDISMCSQVDRITDWPDSLVDIRLNKCSSLTSLPEWPAAVRRIELRESVLLSVLSDFPSTVDYVDLSWTRGLKSLPAVPKTARTLFLYGSGVQEPPSSEHGTEDGANVAEDVADYFREVELTGKGEVRRCKLLILGNGNAGKTCLAMNLAGEDYQQAKSAAEQAGRSISTHGVQFRDLQNFRANIKGVSKPVPLHVWDFGGQEIYHNTHRLFVSKGTLFVVVWNPDPAASVSASARKSTGEYSDTPRPLQYWLDLIRHSCDHMPHIAIVCSRRSRLTAELETAWKSEVREEFHSYCKCFCVDSWNKTGEKQRLLDWLRDEAGLVVETQGTAVPRYWEVAQQMVESWVQQLSRDRQSASQYKWRTLEQFQADLMAAITQVVQKSPGDREKLAVAVRDGGFELTTRRVERTLGFLTRSGWVYWDPQLFGGRIIVDQQWALDGLYTVLERPNLQRGSRPEVYRELLKSRGRFTQSDLHNWVWRGDFQSDEQKLLISFMERCGLCFRIRDAASAWREEDLYVSFEHLPMAKELQLQEEFDACLPDLNLHERTIKSSFLHKYDWQMFLADAGNSYGPDAVYAEDALFFHTKNDQVVLITCVINRTTGFGGTITVQVVGHNADELLNELGDELKNRFPDCHLPGRRRSIPPEAAKEVLPRESVFISYAWNTAAEPEINYEEPVEAIEQFLRRHNFEFEVSDPQDNEHPPVANASGVLLRDRKSVKRHGSLIEFMQRGARSTKVIVVHSKRYWESVNCMFELHTLLRELENNVNRAMAETVITVEHASSDIQNTTTLEKYLEFWRKFQQNQGYLPTRMAKVGWDHAATADHARSTIRTFGAFISDINELNLRWADGADSVLEHIRQRLSLPGRSATAAKDHHD